MHWFRYCQTFDIVKQKKIDTRMDDRLFELVDGYAKTHGMTRTQVVVAAVRQFFGITPANPVTFAHTQQRGIYTPVTCAPTQETTLMAAEEPNNICELPDSGSSPAKTPIRYQPKKQKSSK